MRPVPIPDDRIWEGSRRVVVAGPDGDLTGEIRPVEALVDVVDDTPRFSILIKLDPEDLEKLKDNPHIWLMWWGHYLHPFSIDVEDRS